jgi:hypothetical protein
VLTVHNSRIVRLLVIFFDVLQLPVYTSFSHHVSTKIYALVYEALRSVSAEKLYEIEAAAYDRYAFRSEGQGAAGVAIIARISLCALEEAECYVLAIKESAKLS